MEFEWERGREVLERTPAVVRSLLDGLAPEWIAATEGPETWSPHAVVGHLIHGEETDWIPRARTVLELGESRPFGVFDREAMFVKYGEWELGALLVRFAELRRANLDIADGWRLDAAALARTGLHPEFGRVTLRQHLACWVAHDLSHLAQLARVLARQYRDEVGPWRAYLSVLKDR